jgi:hypothetical protein
VMYEVVVRSDYGARLLRNAVSTTFITLLLGVCATNAMLGCNVRCGLFFL